jgi:DNA repair protein RecN (Recombination protein N)
MLESLAIQDFLLIDRLSLTLDEGLSVFTGETGAGKSILLDALGLALGGRSETGLIRGEAAQASVTASFTGPFPPLLQIQIEEQGLAFGDPLILRRVIGRDGKSRAFLNDQPIGIAFLRQIGDALLEVHGQFETHGLLDPATHRGLLDAFGGFGKELEALGSAYAAWVEKKAALAEAHAIQARSRAEEDYLRASVIELEDLAPKEGEIDRLAALRSQLQNREKILEALQTTEGAINGERGAISALTLAGKALSRIADKAEGLDALLARLDQATDEIQEIALALARRVQDMEDNPETLDSIEERLFALRAVARKHGVESETLPHLMADLQAKLSLLEDKGDLLKQLAKEEQAARTAFHVKAGDLRLKRTKAAALLAKKVMEELPPLKLEKARFIVALTPLPEEQWNANGADRVTFLVSTNPGTEPGPLQKIASGGELARFMLALKVVLAAGDPIGTLVFDEVDTGISGATASAVGERLAKLGEHLQVLVVTHSPQVAARGAIHFHVAKESAANRTATIVRKLTESGRIEAIARLLAGHETSDAARKAAETLLKDRIQAESSGKEGARDGKKHPQKLSKPSAKAASAPRSDREKVGRIDGQAYERESDRQQKLRAFSDHNNPANHFGKRSKNKARGKSDTPLKVR